MGWLAGYDYRKKYLITNGGTFELDTDWSFYLDIDYLVGKMQADYGDVRLTDWDGTTIVPIEFLIADDASPPATVTTFAKCTGQMNTTNWGIGTSRIFYIYYGTSGTSSRDDVCAQGGGGLFDFCDDFNDEAIAAEWIVTGGFTEEAGGFLRLTNSAGIQTQTAKSTTVFGPGQEFSCRVRFETPVIDANYTRQFVGLANNASPQSTGEAICLEVVNGTFRYLIRTEADARFAEITDPVLAYDEWIQLSFQWYPDGSVDFYVNGTFIITISDNAITAEDLFVLFTGANSSFSRTFTSDLDYATVTEITRTESTDLTVDDEVGDEETYEDYVGSLDTETGGMIDDIIFRLKDRIKGTV